MHKTIILSDNLPCKVRQLGLYELTGKGREILGPYKYSLLLSTGQITEDEYDLRALDFTPRPPDMPPAEVTPGSVDWYDLQEYETYLCALAHEKERIASYHGYVDDITAYILANCIDEPNRIVMPDDWDKLYQTALVPELTMEGISAVLRDTFQGFLWWAGDIRRPFGHLQKRREIGLDSPVGM